MIRVVHLCSGLPGSTFVGQLICGNTAQVKLADRGGWKRPMCIECAEAFERRCMENELPAPLFELFPQEVGTN